MPSVSRFAIRDGPRFSRSVEVKPRKSSASGGIRSAPGNPAATASLLGSPPPANPRRTVVFSKTSSSSKSCFSAAAIVSRLSLRRRTATSLSSSSTSSGSLENRTASSSAGCCARTSTGCRRSHCGAHVRPKVRQPPGDRDPEPGRGGRVARLEVGQGVIELLLRASRGRPSPPSPSRRRGAAAARAPRRRCR